jgi:thiol-disulfide isomerase/thioredoxin
MKIKIKFWGTIIIIIMPAILFAQSGSYILNGKVGQLPATARAYLTYSDSTGYRTDSALITNGGFSFAGIIDRPEHAYLIINKKGTGSRANGLNYIEMYLEPGMIAVNSPDSLNNAQITGGQINADNGRLKVLLTAVNAKMEAFSEEYQAASAEQRNSKAFSERGDSLQQEQKAVYLDFIKANPNSLISLFALREYAGPIPDVTEIEPVYNLLSTRVRSTPIGADYAANIAKMKRTAIGAVAPDFAMADTAGKTISLHDFKGKYVLVDFWASWCGPCRAENPNVLKAFNQYKDKGFTVLGVSLDRAGAKDRWLKAIHDDKLTWTQVSDLKF